MKEEKLKKIAKLREMLEERIKNLESELEAARSLLELTNEILLEQSFKRVNFEEVKATEYAREEPAYLKTSDGEVLARIYSENGTIRVIPSEDKRFNVNIPPFRTFLHDRVLVKMREKDEEASRRGEILKDKIFTYNIKVEDDIIKEILLKNVSDERRKSLLSAIHWTLEKMYEKMKRDISTLLQPPP